ncbi:MAG TPA: tetratricopeptide repeat protein [Chloroflexota bacterium]|nr:tetratricopeptide repeat protein [Chloroflexota bacterium]
MKPISRRDLAFALPLVIAVGCNMPSQSPPQPKAALDEPAHRYDGYGKFHRAVTTSSPEAQAWFDQGMVLLYGFNHDEAIRSFHEAARIDPKCAMAWWGVSYANGLHVNNTMMSEEQNKVGYDAAQQAKALDAGASPTEKALISAVTQRFAWPAPADRKPLDQQFAKAMGEAHKAFPDDPDVASLYAESLMDLQPWDYWTADGQPKGNAAEIVRTLESVLAANPQHPGANHFYIHAVEASTNPDRAVAAADRLGALVPGSGHLVHMPAHIYARVGRYDKAVDCNVTAVAADKAYFAKAPPPRFYRIYFLHNAHFLSWAAMMEGRYEIAMNAARQIEHDLPEPFLKENTFIADGFMPTAMHVMVRFGRWDDILKEPEPPAWRYVSDAMWHYSRGVALTAQGNTRQARSELTALEGVMAKTPENFVIHNNPARNVFAIAHHMLEGEISFREGEHARSFDLLRDASVLEDKLVYDEPPGWMHPVRHALGALMIADGKPGDAVAVYEEDLKRNRENGWALIGLEQALRAENKAADADAVKARKAKAWPNADVTPNASCYCQPPR